MLPLDYWVSGNVFGGVTNLATLWEQFREGPFLFQHDCVSVHEARFVKTWLGEFGVQELDWNAQSPDSNPIEHLWDKLEQRYFCPYSVFCFNQKSLTMTVASSFSLKISLLLILHTIL